MRSPTRSVVPHLVAAAFLGLASLALLLLLSPAGSPLRATVVEWLRGERAAARLDAYVRAILRGDGRAAWDAWELPQWELAAGRSAALQKRRQDVTRDLLAAGIRPDYSILHIEWWRTCCEPGVTSDSRSAGGARIQVQFVDRQGQPLAYTVDVFTGDGAYWGAAMGYPVRHWVLRDVYPADEQPLFWRYVYEPAVRSLDAVSPIP